MHNVWLVARHEFLRTAAKRSFLLGTLAIPLLLVVVVALSYLVYRTSVNDLALGFVDYSGTLDGKPVGIAIFDHPRNPKHPTFWHARDYGLFAANPFGEHDFLRDKTRDGSETLRPGESLRFRFRVLIHPGRPADYLAGQYTGYSEKAK